MRYATTTRRRPFTYVRYHKNFKSNESEDVITADFGANLGKELNVGASFDYTYASGFYTQGRSKDARYRVFTSYRGDRYELFGYIANDYYKQGVEDLEGGEEVHHDTHHEYRYPSEDVLHQVQAHGALVERCATTHSPGSEAIDQETEDREDEHSTRTRWVGRHDQALDGLLDDEDRAH